MDYGSSGAGSSGAGGSGSAGSSGGATQQADSASYGGNIAEGQSNGPVILTVSEGDRIPNSTMALWGILLFLSLVVMV